MKRFGPKITAFLAAIRHMPNVTRAAKAAGINKSQHYAKLQSSEDYRAAFDACMAIGCDAMSDVAVERAQIGWDEPVIYKGQISYPQVFDEERQAWVSDFTQQPFSVRKIDNNLLEFVLRSRHPDYKEKRDEKDADAAPAPALIIQTYNDSPEQTAVGDIPEPSPVPGSSGGA